AAGEGALLALTGDLGLGKTRLLNELEGQLVELGIPYLRGAAAEEWQAAPLSLWRAWLFHLLPVEPQMTHAEASASIYEAVTRSDHSAWVEWLAALAVDPQRFLSLDADARERVARGALQALLSHWQQERPPALLVDDAPLLDTLSLQLLQDFAAGAEPALLVALASRPDEQFPPPAARVIRLEPLAPKAARALLAPG